MSLPAISQTPPPPPARFRWRLGIAYPAGLCCAAAALAYLAAQAAHVRAPWILFPVAIGAMTGALAGLLAYWERFAHRPTVLLATAIAGVVVVVGMHYFEYRAYLDAPRSAQFEMMTGAFPDLAERHPGARPDGLFDFLHRMADAGRAMPFGWTAQEGWAWGSWAFDAALLIAAAVLVVWRFVRRPYCDVCRNYYRVLRQESLRTAAYRRLAASLGWSDEAIQSAAYHHATCRGACGPELVRAVVSLESGGTVRREAWIDYADRARLFQQLDQSA